MAKKSVKKRPAVDARGRKIGKRAHRQPPGDGKIMLTGIERALLRAIANRPIENSRCSAFERAMLLEVGGWDVASAGQLQSFAMSFSQARRRGETKGRKFEYGTASIAFVTADKREKWASVLWIIRTK